MEDCLNEKWQIKLFGQLSVQKGGQTIDKFQTSKTALVFAYLALNPGRHLREVICDAIWPYSSSAAARGSLNQAIAWIRKRFDDPLLLLTDRHTVALNYDRVQTDVERFIALTTGAIEREAAESDLEQAAAIYSDDLLKGINEPWIRVDRLLLAEKHLKVLSELVSIEESAGQFAKAAAWQSQLARLEPGSERQVSRLIGLYSKVGDLDAAKRRYEEYCDYLGTGNEPSQEIQLLASQTLALPISVKPSASTPASMASQVPHQLTRFYGREDTIKLLTDLLEAGNRLVSLIGLPGIGKSRLSIEIAHRLSAKFANIIIVPLSGANSLAEAMSAIGKQIEPGNISYPTQEQKILAKLSRSVKVLLVLDNIEHLIEDLTGFIGDLLKGCPNVSILTTSQAKLGLNGEHAVQIDPLPVPSEALGEDELAQCASYMMLVDRVQAANPSYKPSSDDAPILANLCRKLEGYPLAIELAAANAQTSSFEQLATLLSEGYDVLSGHSSDVPTRHQSMRNSFEHCFSMIPLELKALLAQLSVFEGGWTWPAASSVLNIESIESGARQLLARALVMPLDRQEHQTEARFDMLSLMRHFSRQQICSSSWETLVDAHAAYYLGLAKRSQPESEGRHRLEWQRRLLDEMPNLNAALASFEARERWSECLEFASAIGWFWISEGNLDFHSKRLCRLIEHGRNVSDRAVLAQCLQHLGQIELQRTSLDAAEQAFSEALAIDREIGNHLGISTDLTGLGAIALRHNNYTLAENLLQESIERSDGPLNSLYLAFVLTEIGDFERAKKQFERSLIWESQRGNGIGMARVYINLGHWARFQNRLGLASHYVSQGLRIYEAYGQKYGVAHASLILSQIALRQGHAGKAKPMIDRALSLFAEIGDPLGTQSCVSELMRAQKMEGDFEGSAKLMEIAESLSQRLQAPLSPQDSQEFQAIREEVLNHVDPDAIAAMQTDASAMNYLEITTFARSFCAS